ncbi:unnamed protein product [Chironomus riparius]|uniref:UDENN domain-containing protein n=1 Tax=Chironomus riparius TaxID=315576 RepID=A0A9N9S421_9DIPT|nr:unnamed protein product [Chironomus riparius]
MNHVQMIRKRFEDLNLNSEIDSLVDFTPLRDKANRPSELFKRSATLIEFSSSRNREFQTSPEIQQKDKPFSFQRQHSNNSNSSYKSVRRSQAFRLDVDKPNLAKSASPTSTSKLRRQNAIKYNFSPNKTQFEELQYLSSSETIKKALKQPLPKGPAPKKPPRTFAESPKTSPINDDNNLLSDIEKLTNQFNSNSIQISVNNFDRRTRTLPKTIDKKDDKKGISSFLNCIISPCSIDPIYYEQIKHERKLNSMENEDIYMEPYEHLQHMKNSTDPNNKTELHYLCTNLIDDQTNNNTSISPIDIDRSFLDSNKDSSDIESYEKINILMDVAYDEKHRDVIIDESSGSSDLDSRKSPIPKVTRSLTEKRKNYVRRMTETVSSKDLNSSKSNNVAPSASSIISQFQRIIDCHDGGEHSIKKKIDDNVLFKMLLLVGFDMLNQKGYIKSTYPKNEKALPMLEQFIYPSCKYASDLMTKENQNFTLILTDINGNNLFGYCRQIIAEGFEEKCLPLTYCIITKYNASGFYFNLLKEIESRHGYPEAQFSYMMRSLQNQELPKNGKILHVKLFESSHLRKLPEIAKKPEAIQKSSHKYLAKRLSLESPDWLRSETSTLLHKSHEGIVRSKTESIKKSDEIIIKRSNDVRLENQELSVLYESLTNELLVMIFGTLLIERKVIFLGNNITQITSCISALYSLLYPFQWHHIIITIIPDQLTDLLQAPFPFFAGVLKNSISIDHLEIEDGIVVDLEVKSLIRKCGDEATLIPETLRKSMLLSLKIVDAIDKGKKLKNVLIAEAFLQYFIKLFAKLDSDSYSKSMFIQSHNDQAIRYFLEYFLDTIMFKEFLSKKQNDEKLREKGQSSESYFELFNIKILEKSATLSDNQQKKNIAMLMKSTKQKKRNFKDKIKDFLKS